MLSVCLYYTEGTIRQGGTIVARPVPMVEGLGFPGPTPSLSFSCGVGLETRDHANAPGASGNSA